jgi:hypothetical protein
MRAVADAAIRAQREISRRLAEGALHDCTRGWGGRPHPYLATRAQASWMACYAPKKGQGCYMQRVAPLAPVPLRLTYPMSSYFTGIPRAPVERSCGRS